MKLYVMCHNWVAEGGNQKVSQHHDYKLCLKSIYLGPVFPPDHSEVRLVLLFSISAVRKQVSAMVSV